MRVSLLLALFFLCAGAFFAVRLYKTNEIPFLNDAVEGITAVLGIQPDIVKEKIEKKEEVLKKEIEKFKMVEPSVELSSVDSATLKTNVLEEKKKQVFSTLVETENKQEENNSITPIEKKNVFGTLLSAEDNSSNDNETESEPKKNRIAFNSIVHQTAEVSNDGKLRLRLAEAATINKRSYPKDFVFEATVIVYSGKYILEATLEGKLCKNFDPVTDTEGKVIEDKNKAHKGSVLLAEGEKISMFY